MRDLVEREGFEPPIPVSRYGGFQDRCIQPLCHLSWEVLGILKIIGAGTGGERGIRTLDTGFPIYALSRHALSTTQPSLRNKWCAQEDSNL